MVIDRGGPVRVVLTLFCAVVVCVCAELCRAALGVL